MSKYKLKVNHQMTEGKPFTIRCMIFNANKSIDTIRYEDNIGSKPITIDLELGIEEHIFQLTDGSLNYRRLVSDSCYIPCLIRNRQDMDKLDIPKSLQEKIIKFFRKSW